MLFSNRNLSNQIFSETFRIERQMHPLDSIVRLLDQFWAYWIKNNAIGTKNDATGLFTQNMTAPWRSDGK